MGRSVPRNIDEPCQIPLSRGLVALVDAADYEWLNQWKWSAHNSCREFFYAARWSGGRKARCMVYMHRLILGATTTGEVDHINGNRLDNRRANLRIVTHQQNTQNQLTKRKGCSSRHIGVWRRPNGRWTAQITVDYRTIALGTFDTEEQAAVARALAVPRYFGGQHAVGA